jgi:signal transduction histidine kinase
MELVARACHELRGPLTAARLGLQLGERIGELAPERLRALDLELGAAALALDDLAELRGGGPGADVRTSRLEVVDVRELVEESVEAWRPAALGRGAALHAEWSGPPGFVRGDRLRLAQAIGNLLANAIEHGGGLVELRGRTDGDGVRIELTDGGPGLPAPVAELARLPRGGRGARGRGLAIASDIAANQGGRLASAPTERGARLVLEVPAEPPVGDAAGGRGGRGVPARWSGWGRLLGWRV